jgi:type IV secretory pathway component VirB8
LKVYLVHHRAQALALKNELRRAREMNEQAFARVEEIENIIKIAVYFSSIFALCMARIIFYNLIPD